jgi:hypothetical protein
MKIETHVPRSVVDAVLIAIGVQDRARDVVEVLIRPDLIRVTLVRRNGNGRPYFLAGEKMARETHEIAVRR